MWFPLMDLFVTGSNKVFAFNIVRLIKEIRTLVYVSEVLYASHLCV